MRTDIRDYLTRLMANGYLAHLLTIAGFLLALFLVARLMSEKKAPANTFAWLLGIILIPYVGVPLFLIFGGRKLRKLAKQKTRIFPMLPGDLVGPKASEKGAVSHTLSSSGACPPVGGNCLELFTTGEAEFAALEKAINEAEHTIHITTFILGRDETGRRVVDLLARRAREGIKVRLLLDAIGCLFSSSSFVQPIRDAGGDVGKFMPVMPFSSRGSANLRNHRKIAIFDHAKAILGGRNIAKEYMGPKPMARRWHDFGAVVAGPAAALLNEIFIADWCFATGQKPEALRSEIAPEVALERGKSEVQVVASGPDVPGDPLYEGIVSMIQEAEESIWIVTPYFIPDEVLLRSLIVKARAGRDVTLVVPTKSNHPVTDYARRYYTRELRKAGGRVLLFPDGMLHSKGVIVDERIGLLGSANFDLRSLFVNFEVGVFIYSRPDVLAMKEWARGLIEQSSPPKTDAAKPRNFAMGLVEDLSRLLAPLL